MSSEIFVKISDKGENNLVLADKFGRHKGEITNLTQLRCLSLKKLIRPNEAGFDDLAVKFIMKAE